MSIVIPTYNREKYVACAIDSCFKQFDDERSVEIIALDDGSTDNSREILASYGDRIRYVPNEVNRGRNHVRNQGLALARGDFVKFLDSDDYLLPGTLEKEYALAMEEEADVVTSGWRVVEQDGHGRTGRETDYFPPEIPHIVDGLLAGKAVPCAAALYRRKHIADKRWDTELHELDDWDWFINASIGARRIAAAASLVSFVWRRHAEQGSRSYTMFANSKAHHYILGKLEKELSARGELDDKRRKRLAQYYLQGTASHRAQ